MIDRMTPRRLRTVRGPVFGVLMLAYELLGFTYIYPFLLQTDFRAKFNAIHREHSPTPRKFYGFCTSVTVSLVGLLPNVPCLKTALGYLFCRKSPQHLGLLLVVRVISSTFSKMHGPRLNIRILVRDMVVREHLRKSKLI